MTFTVKTEIADPEVALYNELFRDLKEAFSKTYITTESHEYDPDGYIQIEYEQFSVGVAFVIEDLEPLIFNVVFEKPYSKKVQFARLPKNEQIKIQSILQTVFNEQSLQKNGSNEGS